MLPCPKCSSDERVEVVGQGPQQVEIRAMDERGNPTEVFRHPRMMYECVGCNVTLIENRIAGTLEPVSDEKGKPVPTRADEEARQAKIIADDRKRIYDPRASGRMRMTPRRSV